MCQQWTIPILLGTNHFKKEKWKNKYNRELGKLTCASSPQSYHINLWHLLTFWSGFIFITFSLNAKVHSTQTFILLSRDYSGYIIPLACLFQCMKMNELAIYTGCPMYHRVFLSRPQISSTRLNEGGVKEYCFVLRCLVNTGQMWAMQF